MLLFRRLSIPYAIGLCFLVAIFWYTANLGLARKETNLVQKPISINLKPKPHLDVFGPAEYESALKIYPVKETNCKWISNISPTYRLCAFDREQDLWMSGGILDGRGWEPTVANVIRSAMKLYNRPNNTFSADGPVFLDVGASLGSHALFIANQGFRTWAVEPLTMNLVRLYHAAKLNNSTQKLKVLHHTVSERAGPSVIRVAKKNIAGSAMVLDRSVDTTLFKKEGEAVRSVLLSEVFRALVKEENKDLKKIVVLLKLDVEKFECRAVLGSKEMFRVDDTKHYFIPYIFMEWILTKPPPRFGAQTSKVAFSPACSEDLLLSMVTVLSQADYHPYREGTGEKLDVAFCTLWGFLDVIWVHKDAHRLF